MIGDRVKVEWLAQLHVETGGMSDGFAFGVAIRIVRCGDRSEGKRIERILGVHVQIAKIGAAIGVRRRIRDDEVRGHLQLSRRRNRGGGCNDGGFVGGLRPRLR